MRSRRLPAFARNARLLALCVLWAGAAAAQVHSSELPPVESFDSAEQSAPTEASTPNTASTEMDALGVTSGTPSAVAAMSISRAQALAAVGAVPDAVPSAAMRLALVQGLAAEWPTTDDDTGVPAGAILAARVEKLTALGGLPQAADLLARVAQAKSSPLLEMTALPALWLGQDALIACRRAEAAAAVYETPAWANIRALCKLEAASVDEAQLAIDLMDEQQQAVNPLLRVAISARRLKQPLVSSAAPKNPVLWETILLARQLPDAEIVTRLAQLPVGVMALVAEDPARPALVRAYAKTLRDARMQPNPAGQWVTPARLNVPAAPTDVELREAMRSYAVLKALGEPVDAATAASWPMPTQAIIQHSISPAALDALEQLAPTTNAQALVWQAARLVGDDLRAVDDQAFARIVGAIAATGDRGMARDIAADGVAAFQRADAIEKARAAAEKAVQKTKKPKAAAKPASKPKP